MRTDRYLSLALAASLAALSMCAATTGNAGTTSLSARGNEPGWQVRIAGNALSFNVLGGESFEIRPAPQPIRQGGADTYQATVGGRQFALTVAAGICVDTMSGMPYPRTAFVVLGDRKLAGCAGEPAELLHGDWQVAEIRGKPPVAGSKPTLAFDPDGRIHGNGSCNRFFGGFTLTGESLAISETGASMMMCEQPLMDQERGLLKALEAIERFEVTQDGQVRLLGREGQEVVSLRR